MTQDRHIDSPNETDDDSHAAKLTAHALGQLDAEEAWELENALADGDNEAETAEFKQLGDLLREALQREPKLATSPTLRAALERRATESAQAVRPADDQRDERRGRYARWKFIATVAAGVLLVAAGLEIARNYRNLSQPFQVAKAPTSQDVVDPTASQETASQETASSKTASRESKEGDLASNEHAAAGTRESSESKRRFGVPAVITSDDGDELKLSLNSQSVAGFIPAVGEFAAAHQPGSGDRSVVLGDEIVPMSNTPVGRAGPAVGSSYGRELSAGERGWQVEHYRNDHASTQLQLQSTPRIIVESGKEVGGYATGGRLRSGVGVNGDAGVIGDLVAGTAPVLRGQHRTDFGQGTIGGDVSTVSPGNSRGVLSVDGAYSRANKAAPEAQHDRYDRSGFRFGKLPHQPTNTEQYESSTENPFQNARQEPLSTFSVDVDTASYANTRRLLRSGRLPPRGAVRVEEMVNYFQYDYSAPTDEHPFSVNLEVAQCPWNEKHRLLRVALAGRQVERGGRGPCNLVFLLDVSGSMRDENKLPLVQRAMKMLVDELTEDDRVAIVTYAGEAGVKLQPTGGHDKRTIQRAIDSLRAGGSTNGGAGIQLAYDLAAEHFVAEGANRVILATDGDLNVGITSDEALVELIQRRAEADIFLTVIGFGTGNLKDSKLEKLADHGNGVYRYIDNMREARRTMVQQMTGNLLTIAKDVKLQLDFNCAEVAAYRLIGYENRLLAEEDFANDSKDAGEIGAGHQVTAFYELVPVGTAAPSGAAASRYQRVLAAPQNELTELTEAAASGDLLTLELRYKQPTADESELMTEYTLRDEDKTFGQASRDFRFATATAAFGMILRDSQYRGNATLAKVEQYAASAMGDDATGHRAEFLDLVQKASQLGRR